MARLRADDGVEVEADLALSEDAWAGAVICHPHPAYGGDRHNAVVDQIYRTLSEAGLSVLRFDFRKTGKDEDRDVEAALDELTTHLAPGVPLWLIGYSYGADITLSVADARVTGWIAVAPPLRFGQPARPSTGDPRPVLLLAAEHDQFTSPAELLKVAATWPTATVNVIGNADHFLAGATQPVAEEVQAWLTARRR